MRKAKLLLAAVLCTVAAGNAGAQITGNSQLSNTKVYTVTTPRGAWMVDQTGNRMHYDGNYTSSSATPKNDVNYQFAFINHEGHYYLYAPAMKKFVQPQKYFRTGYTTPVTLAAESGKVKVKGEETPLTINIGGAQWTWDTWTSYDDGNTVTIVEAADLSAADLNEAISILTGTPDYFDSHKVYTINCERVGNWAASADHNSLSSTLAYPGATDAEKQFAFYHKDGKLYIYSVGAKKFLKGDGTFVTGKLGDPMDYRIISTSGYDHMLYVPATHFYFNSQTSGGYAINSYSSADAGNKQSFTEVNGLDVFDEMDLIANPSYFVTYVVKDEDGATIFTSEPVATNLGASITSLPADFRRSFYTYNDVDVTVSDFNTTVEFTATWDGPFEISTDYATAHWYNMAVRGNYYVTSGNKATDGSLAPIPANAMGLVEDAYQWAFIGNNYDGFKAINKAEGDSKAYAWVSNDNSSIPTFVDYATANKWYIKASTSSVANSFMLTTDKGFQTNQFGGATGSLKIWADTRLNDAGSAFTTFNVPTNFANFVVDEIAPAMEAIGYFAFTDEVKATIGWDPAYKTECPYESYKNMKEKLTAIDMTDISNYVLPETGYYTLKNKNYGTYMGIDPSDAVMYGNYASANEAKQVVKLTKTGAATYTIGLMGKFAPAAVAQSETVSAKDEAGTYTVVVPTVGFAAFQADTENSMSVLHQRAAGDIVGWGAPAAASQWEVQNATSIELTIGAEGYATTYLPFPVEYGGISMPKAIGCWTFDDPSDLLAGTGIATLQATTHEKDNVTVTDVATAGITTVDGPDASNGAVEVPVGSSLLMAANNGATSMGTYSIMYDVCVEDGSTFIPLLQNSLTDGKDGSLFINKNQVGLGGGIGYHGNIENNKWYRIVFTVSPSEASLYVDGNLLTTYNQNFDNVNGSYLKHWVLTTGALFFVDEDGEEKAIKASELRFWDVALNAQQVSDLGSISGDAPKFPEALGTWTFEDATDPYAGTGTATLADWGTGVTFDGGVATVPVGAGMELNTNLTTTPTAYTLMQDVKFANVSGYISLFQNDVNNGKDGSIFVKDGTVGLNSAGLGYKGTINADTWYRIVTVIDNSYCTLYVDGVQVGKSAAQDVNAWAMRDSRKLILFIDNDGEETEVQLAEARFWDKALTAAQVAELATVGTTIDEGESKDAVAYTAQLDGSNKWLVLNKLDGTIPTKTAVVLKGAPKTYVYNIVAEASPITDNVLKGTLEPIEATGKYVLAKPAGEEVGFYLANTGNIAACKAYLEINSEIKGFVFKFDDDATGIDDISDYNNAKNLNESKAIYNLAGQRLNKMQKGINIVNGKKIMVK